MSLSTIRDTFRDWMAQVMAWDISERQTLQRAHAAVAYGLSPDRYARPFPGSTPSVVTMMASSVTPEVGQQTVMPAAPPTQQQKTAKPCMSAAMKAGIVAAALGIGGGAAALTAWLNRPTPPEVTTSPTGGWDAVYEQQNPDGSWKLLKRETLVKPKP